MGQRIDELAAGRARQEIELQLDATVGPIYNTAPYNATANLLVLKLGPLLEKLEVHGRARREAARRRKSKCKINFRKTKFLSQ